MVARIFDPGVFRGQGALIDFAALSRPHQNGRNPGTVDPVYLKGQRAAIFLRWQLNPRVGMPSEPFKVWRRPAAQMLKEQSIPYQMIGLPPVGHVIVFDQPVVSFTLNLGAGSTPQQVQVLPMADGVGLENMLGIMSVHLPANSSQSVTFQAAYITAILLTGFYTINDLVAVPAAAMAQLDGWELVETVGLPVSGSAWTGLDGQSHGKAQGLVSSLQTPEAAAADRYRRGINPFGWYPTLPSGRPAPNWELPGAEELIEEAGVDLLPILRQAMAKAPREQASYKQGYIINPPQNASGQTMSGNTGKAELAPLTLLQLAASTDPLLAVVLGFGTGYLYEPIHYMAASATHLSPVSYRSDWDFMVTGLWARGLDGKSTPLEYAALIPRPERALPPPAPADLRLTELGIHQPAAVDQPWNAAVRLSWERLTIDNLSRAASFAVARSDLAKTGSADALMERRVVASGHMPIGNMRSQNDPEAVRQSATDSGFPIPNDPGSVSAQYGVATQSIFGIWSPWVVNNYRGHQPPPDPVQIADLTLVPVDPGPPATVCPGTLTVEFVLDWRARRVRSVQFRGRLFPAATRHDDPPAGFPAQVQTALSGTLAPVVVNFSGDVPAVSTGSIICLDPQGKEQVAPGPAAQGTRRRYRITVPGFQLDYAATPHIGLALQARLTEQLAPSRSGPWSPATRVAYASDPRARPTAVTPLVPLASLPDARGECHARLSWNAQPAAAGYVVYTSNEQTLYDRTGQAVPPPGRTLTQRLVALKAAFNAKPDRNVFTRIHEGLLTVTSLDVTLPRGSQAIHCWLVLPVSAGGVEAPWPSGPNAADALIVYAAPKVAEPAPPTMEVIRVRDGDGFAARVTVTTRSKAGATSRRIDLYRTRVTDAARQLDSMGYPIAEVTTTSGPWTVIQGDEPSADQIDRVFGLDAPEGSWKYVWYRAVAWAEPVPEQGVLGGRSAPSPAVPVVVPPATPPPLSELNLEWPGGGAGNVGVRFLSPVPVAAGPLGHHRIDYSVYVKGSAEPLLSKSLKMSEVENTAPPAPESGLWREAEGEYRMLVRRESEDQVLSVSVRITDPLGRSTEKTLEVEAGSVIPLPELSEVQRYTITGRGTIFSFNVQPVLGDLIAGQPYVLKLTLHKEAGDIIPAAPKPGVIRLPGAGRSPGRISPKPGPLEGKVTGTGHNQFSDHGKTLTFQSPLHEIPTTPPSGSYTVARQQIGQVVTITLTTRGALSGLTIQLTAPDGREVSRTVK